VPATRATADDDKIVHLIPLNVILGILVLFFVIIIDIIESELGDGTT
jgi:hypothetical protein